MHISRGELEMKWSAHGRVELSVNPPETGKKVLTMAEYIEREAAVDAVTDIYYDTP